MNTLPTLMLEQDVERTVVDSRFDRDDRSVLRGMRSRGMRSRGMLAPLSRWRVIVASVLALLTMSGLSLALYREREVTRRLREALAMTESCPSRLASDTSSGAHVEGGRVVYHSTDAPPFTDATSVDREELEQRGAILLGSNDFPEALLHYRRLAAHFPDEQVFRDFVTVLRAKLRCQTARGESVLPCD